MKTVLAFALRRKFVGVAFTSITMKCLDGERDAAFGINMHENLVRGKVYRASITLEIASLRPSAI